MLSSRFSATCARRSMKQSVRPFFSSFAKPDEPANEGDLEEEETTIPPLFKGGIVEKIAEEHEMTKAQADRILTTVLDTIVEVRTTHMLCLDETNEELN